MTKNYKLLFFFLFLFLFPSNSFAEDVPTVSCSAEGPPTVEGKTLDCMHIFYTCSGPSGAINGIEGNQCFSSALPTEGLSDIQLTVLKDQDTITDPNCQDPNPKNCQIPIPEECSITRCEYPPEPPGEGKKGIKVVYGDCDKCQFSLIGCCSRPDYGGSLYYDDAATCELNGGAFSFTCKETLLGCCSCWGVQRGALPIGTTHNIIYYWRAIQTRAQNKEECTQFCKEQKEENFKLDYIDFDPDDLMCEDKNKEESLKEYCGDGIQQPWEECDSSDFICKTMYVPFGVCADNCKCIPIDELNTLNNITGNFINNLYQSNIGQKLNRGVFRATILNEFTDPGFARFFVVGNLGIAGGLSFLLFMKIKRRKINK